MQASCSETYYKESLTRPRRIIELQAYLQPYSFISKATEKVVAARLNRHIHDENLHEVFQSAYKRGHSTETALVRVHNDILRNIDDNCCTILILLDLSAAFDTVNHNILLNRLDSRFGIKNKALNWIRSYLTDRTQFVTVENERSSPHNLTCGVPQGSVLGPILYLLYTTPLSDIIKQHNMSYHFYADDSQIYLSFKSSGAGEPHFSKSLVEKCINDINNWMTANMLKLNNDKSELLVLHARHRPQPPLDSIYAGTELVQASQAAKNIGVWFDRTLSMDKQVSSICKTAFYHLRNISSIRKYLSFHHCEILIHAFVSSKLDNCNSLLFGLPQHRLQRLQYIQNCAARILTGTKKKDHITPILKDLHWLPVLERINFKILLLTFKTVNDLAPSYLKDILVNYKPTRNLRSSNKNLLTIPKYNLKSYGYRAFSVSAPLLWNSLPDDIRCVTSLTSFKSKVKTFLFKRSYST